MNKKRLEKNYYVPAVLLLVMAFVTGMDYFFKCVNGINLNVLDSNRIINLLYLLGHWIFVVPGFAFASFMLITKRKGFLLSLPFVYLSIVTFLLIGFDLGAGFICLFTNDSVAVNVVLTSIVSEMFGNVLLFSAFICTAINVIANWMNKKSRIWFIPGALALSWGIAWSISLYMTNNFGIYTGDITIIQLFENMFSTIGLDSVISMTPELPKISIGLLVFALFIINSKLSKDLDKGYIDVE